MIQIKQYILFLVQLVICKIRFLILYFCDKTYQLGDVNVQLKNLMMWFKFLLIYWELKSSTPIDWFKFYRFEFIYLRL
jgi:hypothetical protein